VTAQKAAGAATKFNELLLPQLKKSMRTREIPVAMERESHYRFFHWGGRRGVAWWRGIVYEHNKIPHRQLRPVKIARLS